MTAPDHGPDPLGFRAALRSLPHATGHIWRREEGRRRAIVAVAEALDGPDAESLQRVVRVVDDAVVGGLAAVRFPRGPVQGVEIERSRTMWAGRKDPGCTLILSADSVRRNLQLGRPDAIFRTWVHESLHARQPYAEGHATEYRRAPGYEEGLVEGLTREILRGAGSFDFVGGSFDYYLSAWRSLAELLAVSPHEIWRRSWMAPPGRVRAGFADAINESLEDQGQQVLPADTLERLQAMADTLFSPARASAIPDAATLDQTWRLVLP